MAIKISFSMSTRDLESPDFLGHWFELSRVGHTMAWPGQFPFDQFLVKQRQNM